ncbi:MAG: 50S ribosomal protein L11 methyltransferase [Pseudomonadota bacterium]
MTKRRRDTSKWWTGGIQGVDVGERLRLTPYWERHIRPVDRVSVVIEPGPAFGAGDHPSTVMALGLLELALKQAPRIAPSMLDAGTGTGVLAIAGKLLGAGYTVGFDVDPAAVYCARRNLGINGLSADHEDGVSPVDLLVGTIEAIRGTFDIVAANLAAPTLMRVSARLAECSARHLILSGIADAMEGTVLDRYLSLDFTLVERRKASEWNAFLMSAGRYSAAP